MENFLVQIGLGLFVIAIFLIFHYRKIAKIKKALEKRDEEIAILRAKLNIVSRDVHF